jgi:hypothetical protein
MTNEEAIKELEKYPKDAEVKRQMTAEYGTVSVEEIRFEDGQIVID